MVQYVDKTVTVPNITVIMVKCQCSQQRLVSFTARKLVKTCIIHFIINKNACFWNSTDNISQHRHVLMIVITTPHSCAKQHCQLWSLNPWFKPFNSTNVLKNNLMISNMFVIERQSLPVQACANDNITSSHICSKKLRVLCRLCKWFSKLTRLIMSPNITVIMVISMFSAKSGAIHSRWMWN